MNSYYQFINRVTDQDGAVTTHYLSTLHVQGAWNPHEQHMAPVSGLIAVELEHFLPRADMRIGRISFDIFGLIHAGEFSITTQVIRPGKTIELVESKLQANGKTCVVARAWRMLIQDSTEIAGLEDQTVDHPESLPTWSGISHWPGAYVQTIKAKAAKNHRAGKGVVWVTTQKEIVDGHPNSDFSHLIGLIDIANGIVVRQESSIVWAFPNLDLQIHMYRQPTGKWLGLETVQQYGNDGIGLTSSVLHDAHGPFGRSEQILTLRKMDEKG